MNGAELSPKLRPTAKCGGTTGETCPPPTRALFVPNADAGCSLVPVRAASYGLTWLFVLGHVER